MCHFNFYEKKKNVEPTFDVEIDLPVLFVTQLLGIAFGFLVLIFLLSRGDYELVHHFVVFVLEDVTVEGISRLGIRA